METTPSPADRRLRLVQWAAIAVALGIMVVGASLLDAHPGWGDSSTGERSFFSVMVGWIPALLGVVAAGAWCLRARVRRPSVHWPLGLLALAVLTPLLVLATTALGVYALVTDDSAVSVVTVVGFGWLLAATSESLTAGVAHPVRHRLGCMASFVAAVVLAWQWWQFVEAVATVPHRAWLLWTPLPLAMLTHVLGVALSRRLSVPNSATSAPPPHDGAAPAE